MNNHKTLWALLICLYFSQGLPSGLLAHALPAIMRSYGVGLEWIGLIKLLALPWLLKFLWAPFIDQYWQRKYWILLFQGLVITLLLVLSMFNPETIFDRYLIPFLLLLFLLNTCSASQDIASDGLAVQQLPVRYLGFANSIQVGAYKIGLILGGTALLIVLDHWGWQYTFQLFALMLLLTLIPIALFKGGSASTSCLEPVCHVSFMAAMRGFLAQKQILPWLCVIITYKMSDGLGSGMIKPMLIDHGYSLADIGYLTSTSSIIGILGAALSGFLFLKMSCRQSLLYFGAFQALTIGLLAFIPQVIESVYWVYTLTLMEQFADGLSTVALFAAMMTQCRKGLEGTDYTLQTSFQLMGSGMAALGSGFIAANLGYPALFLFAALLGFSTLVFILFFYKNASGSAIPG
jgi:MFS family permease